MSNGSSEVFSCSNTSNKLVSSFSSYADALNDKYELSGMCFCLIDDFIAVCSCLSIHRFANVLKELCCDFEKQVLHRYTNGESYTEIAEKVDAPVKSVDNAIQRIRKKTIKNLLNYDE